MISTVGGGTALLYKSQLRILDYNDKDNLETMEYSSYQLRLGNRKLNLLVIYRLPHLVLSTLAMNLPLLSKQIY